MSVDKLNQPIALDPDAVAAYLRANPDFFITHKLLLAELNLPHASGRAISLVERQVDILRERNLDMRKRMNELLHTARLNDDLFAKTRSLTLALLDAHDLPALNEVLATHVLVDFDADFVAVHVQVDRSPSEIPLDHLLWHDTTETSAFPSISKHVSHGSRAVCTSLRADELVAVFPMTDHGAPGSAVLLPLQGLRHSGTSPAPGVLAIGSRDGNHFAPSMDTLFVTYIADVLSLVLARLL